jgi:hypothetical protein
LRHNPVLLALDCQHDRNSLTGNTMKTLATGLVLLAAMANSLAGEFKKFDFEQDKTSQSGVNKTTCDFAEVNLPSDFAVFAAGAYSGRKLTFQIDQSHHDATRMDVAVNSPNKPVVLMLGAYEPTIWNIGWSRGTRILAVLVSGYHRQVIAGLEPKTPFLVSTYDNKGPCGHFYVQADNLQPLNPLARRVFGRPVDMAFPAVNGKVLVGNGLSAGTELITYNETQPEPLQDKLEPLPGEAGLEQAVRKGVLRVATGVDVQIWEDALRKARPQGTPPVAGMGAPSPLSRSALHNTFVVQKPFVFPAGLFGAQMATFYVLQGVPPPQGNPGHSVVYDFNSMSCKGVSCKR